MWNPYDTGLPVKQRGSFLQPVTPPTTDICDAPLYCFSINQEWLPYLVGAAMQLCQPSTWATGSAADLELALRRATDLVLELGSAVSCQPAPYIPPGTDTPQQACNISGYLANFVIRESMLKAVQAAQQNLNILNYGLIIIRAIPGVSVAYSLFSSAIIDFLARITGGNLSDYQDALADDSLWAEVTCAIYGAISADGAVTAANFPAVQSALCSLSYSPSDVTDAICSFITNLGVQNILGAQMPGAMASYTCTCTGTPAIAPPGSPLTPIQDTGVAQVLISAGEAIGQTLITFAAEFGSTPVITTGTDDPTLIPSVASSAKQSFLATVTAARPVASDTMVSVPWTALIPGSTS